MHFLAEQLGGFTVKELGDKMTAVELMDWVAYYTIKGEEEDEARKRAELEAKAKQSAQGRRWL